MSNREKRCDLIRKIQEARKSKVVVYFTGDRRGAASVVAEDAVLPLYNHLLAFEAERLLPRLDLFLYTRGGDVGVPWRIVTMIREFCSEFAVLVPYRAYSAGTMIALGADRIVMGKKAELSPIDPTLERGTAGESAQPPREVSVEDVSSYVSFMRDRTGITDQAAITHVISQLADHLTPLTLGRVNRQHSHIRLVAGKLLTSGKKKADESKVSTIIEALTEKMYSHGHAIGRSEASDIGLPVDKSGKEIETLIWDLYKEYEDLLQLTDPVDPEELFTREGEELYTLPNVPIAAIETESKLSLFEISYTYTRKRQVPPNPQINLNLNLGLPPTLDLAKLPQDLQRVFEQMMGQISQAIPQLVQRELVRQSPVVGIEGRAFGGKWKNNTE